MYRVQLCGLRKSELLPHDRLASYQLQADARDTWELNSEPLDKSSRTLFCAPREHEDIGRRTGGGYVVGIREGLSGFTVFDMYCIYM